MPNPANTHLCHVESSWIVPSVSTKPNNSTPSQWDRRQHAKRTEPEGLERLRCVLVLPVLFLSCTRRHNMKNVFAGRVTNSKRWLLWDQKRDPLQMVQGVTLLEQNNAKSYRVAQSITQVLQTQKIIIAASFLVVIIIICIKNGWNIRIICSSLGLIPASYVFAVLSAVLGSIGSELCDLGNPAGKHGLTTHTPHQAPPRTPILQICTTLRFMLWH